MKIFYSIDNISIKNAVLTVGTFDGVHLGHRKILDHLVKSAKKLNAQSVVFTFFPHPRQVIFPDSADLMHLNSQKEKIKLLEQAGVDNLIIYPFTKEFAQYDSCYFIENILHKQLNVKYLVVGHDHHFGKDRQGNVEVLKKCAKPYNLEVERIEALLVNNVSVSSTKIRNLLTAGEIKTANNYLGYNYSFCGKVVHGNKIGREIGFPTANIEIKDINKLIPKNGVYAVEVSIENSKYGGMLNIGKKPTVRTSSKSDIEVHIFDFNQTIYDADIQIYFLDFLRDEIKFKSLDELKSKLKTDEQKARKIIDKVSAQEIRS